MSNDLIKRSDVIKIIKDELREKSLYVEHNAQIDILFKVKEIPTAYDADKIVKQLEQIKTDNSCYNCKYKNKCDELQEFYNPSDDVDLCGLTIKHIAIEIAKACGTNKGR